MTSINPASPRRRSALERDSLAKRYPLAAIEHSHDLLVRLDQALFLTNDQLEALLFTDGPTASGKPRSPKGAPYAANTALRRLFDAGFIARIPVFLPSPIRHTVKPGFVNVLSAKGAKEAATILTSQHLEPRWRRSLLPRPWQPVLHGFWIREVAVLGEVACRRLGWRWWNWLDDRQLAALKKTHGARYQTIPDSFVMLTNPTTGKHFPHFLEVDLGSQSVSAHSPTRPDWRGKVASYVAYLKDGFRDQFGVATLPVVLTITSSARRLDNLLAVTGGAGGAGRFWFTTLAEWSATAPENGGFAGLGGRLRASLWRTPIDNRLRSLEGRYAPFQAPG